MLIKKGKDATLVCRICGDKETPNHYYNAASMWHNEMCFGCDFWQTRASQDKSYPEHTIVIANGIHYIIGDEDDKGFRGFGGSRVKVKFNDGTERLSTNLWCQGDIPQQFKHLFPDNAKLEWLH